MTDIGLARPTAIIAAGTIASRVTGLLRVLALTYALGIAESRLADTFNVANTLPNILYDLILGGVLSSVFVPLVVEAFGEEDGPRRVGTLIGTALAVLTAASVVAAAAAPLLVRAVTFRGGVGSAGQSGLATFLFRFFAFQILFYGMTALYAGVLNARQHFTVPAFAPVANNVVATVTLVIFGVAYRNVAGVDVPLAGKLLLGLGTTAAVAVMAVLHFIPLRRVTGRLPLRVSFADPLVRRFARLSGWTLIYVVTSQVEASIALVLAYGTQGGASAYLTALTFFQLPYGVLAVSVTTALVPVLAARAAEQDLVGFRGRFEDGIRATVSLVLPASVGYILLAHPLMQVLLVRGRVTAASAAYVARLTQLFCVGLTSYSLWLLFLRAFYSLQDARTPVFVNFAETAVFVVLDLVLYRFLRVEGLAWSHAIGFTVGAVIAARLLDRRLGGLHWRGLAAALAKAIGVSAVMGLVMWTLIHRLSPHLRGSVGSSVVVVVAGLAGAATLVAAAVVFGVDELLSWARLIRLKPRPGGGPRPRAD